MDAAKNISIEAVEIINDARELDTCDSMDRGNVRFEADGIYDGKDVLVVWEFPQDIMPEDADFGLLDWDNSKYITIYAA